MSLRIDVRYGSVGEADLIVFAERIGRPIPAPYRSFLLEHNGGRPSPGGFDWAGEHGHPRGEAVEAFLAVHPRQTRTCDTFAWILPTYEGRYPADLFPIARALGSNLVLIGADDGPNAGKVFFWEHDWEADDGEEADYRNVHLVANSFEEFLGMLRD